METREVSGALDFMSKLGKSNMYVINQADHQTNYRQIPHKKFYSITKD